MPPQPFCDLRQTSRYRRTLTGDRSRVRNRSHKALMDGRTDAEILPKLGGHMRGKLELPERELEACRDACMLWRLSDPLQRLEELDRSIADTGELLNLSPVPREDQLRILETVPGIGRGSACAILIELRPDASAFCSARHLAVWAGVAPGHHKSAGKRLLCPSRKGNATLKTTLVECSAHWGRPAPSARSVTATKRYARRAGATSRRPWR